MNWKEQDRALDARSRMVFKARANTVPDQPDVELLTLTMGPHKPPTHYVRMRLPLAVQMRGRTATLPWRKV